MALTGDLALDLFPELQGILDFLEHFGRAAGAAHDHRPIAQDSSHGGLVHHDTFDSGEEDFRGAAFRKDLGIERHFRDARAAVVMAPTSDALDDFIDRAVSGLPLFG